MPRGKQKTIDPDRFNFGEYVSETPNGRVVSRLAMVHQRRYSISGKYITSVIGCPYCGEYHEHSDGFGFRVPHCANRKPGSGEYFILDNDEPPVPAYVPDPQTGRGRFRCW